MQKQFYVYRAGAQLGPFVEVDLQKIALRGELTDSDLVWTEGMPGWVPWLNIFRGPASVSAISAGSQCSPQKQSNKKIVIIVVAILMVVIVLPVLMYVFLAAGIFMSTGNLKFAKEQRARGDIQAIVTQLRMFEMKSGAPLSQSQGLQGLVGKGRGFDELPKDPWGEDYLYKVDASSPRGFWVYSKGPNRKDNSGSGDDISSP